MVHGVQNEELLHGEGRLPPWTFSITTAPCMETTPCAGPGDGSFEEDQKPHNAKVLNREVGRLETSLKAAEGRSIFCFLHYPPLYQGYECPEILRLLSAYPVERCCYGHLHGYAIKRRLEGRVEWDGLLLISADYLGFVPKKNL